MVRRSCSFLPWFIATGLFQKEVLIHLFSFGSIFCLFRRADTIQSLPTLDGNIWFPFSSFSLKEVCRFKPYGNRPVWPPDSFKYTIKTFSPLGGASTSAEFKREIVKPFKLLLRVAKTAAESLQNGHWKVNHHTSMRIANPVSIWIPPYRGATYQVHLIRR